MKSILTALVICIFSASSSAAMSPRFYENEILGNWICKDFWPGYSAFEVIRYKKDGTWNSFGELSLISLWKKIRLRFFIAP